MHSKVEAAPSVTILGVTKGLISPRATADFWVILMGSWDWLITQLSLSA